MNTRSLTARLLSISIGLCLPTLAYGQIPNPGLDVANDLIANWTMRGTTAALEGPDGNGFAIFAEGGAGLARLTTSAPVDPTGTTSIAFRYRLVSNGGTRDPKLPPDAFIVHVYSGTNASVGTHVDSVPLSLPGASYPSAYYRDTDPDVGVVFNAGTDLWSRYGPDPDGYYVVRLDLKNLDSTEIQNVTIEFDFAYSNNGEDTFIQLDGIFDACPPTTEYCCETDLSSFTPVGSGDCDAFGACCLYNGTCIDVTATACASMGGIARESGVLCASTDSCSLACCKPDGTCAVMPTDQCINSTNQGLIKPSVTCTGVQCGGTVCCYFASNTLCVDLDHDDCAGLGGLPQQDVVACAAPSLPSNAVTIDFENLIEGQFVSAISIPVNGLGSSTLDVIVDGYNDQNTSTTITNLAVVFNSAAPTGNDIDLGTPNEKFPKDPTVPATCDVMMPPNPSLCGPGVGSEGVPGKPFENSIPKGHILIVNEETYTITPGTGGSPDTIADPNDNGNDGILTFDFTAFGSVEFYSITMLDIDNGTAQIKLTPASGGPDITIVFPEIGCNGVGRMTLCAPIAITQLEVNLFGSGALDDIVIAPVLP